MLLSVIIPVYLVEDYIDACLARVAELPAAQTEVLLVDDCGSDGSLAIAETYCKRYAHFHLLRRERNGGLSAARNTGLDVAQGEYIYFLDSDDLVEPSALWHLVQSAKDLSLDVAKARFAFLFDATGEREPGPPIPVSQPVAGSALFAEESKLGLYEPMVWQCVYRRAFLTHIDLRMPEGLLFEDELFQTPALLAAERVAAFSQVILLYRQREGSIMSSFGRSARWCGGYLEICRNLSALCDTLPEGDAQRALRQRIGLIALNTARNVSAYRLPPAVAAQAFQVVYANRAELNRYIKAAPGLGIAIQGAMFALSPRLYAACYNTVRTVLRR